MNFKNRIYIVTGAAGNLASQFVNTLNKQGSIVYALDTNIKKLNQINSLRDKKYSINVTNFSVDVTNENQVKTFFKKVKKLDGIINAAAINPKIDNSKSNYSKFINYSLKDWDLSLRVCLNGTFLMSKHACKIFEKKMLGNIINISSTYGIVSPDQRVYTNEKFTNRLYKPLDYSTSKHGIIGFTKSLAAYYHNTKIRINCLSPGGVEENQSNEFKKNYSAKTIIGRMSKKNEYESAILFMLSDDTSYMTGSNLVIDGGWTSI